MSAPSSHRAPSQQPSSSAPTSWLVAAARENPLSAIAVAVTLVGLAAVTVIATEAAAGGNAVLMDAGAIARRGAPIAAMIGDLAAALALGGGLVAGWLLRVAEDRRRAMGVVAIAAGGTTVARGAAFAFSYAIATGQPVGSPRFGSDLGVFLGTDLGIWLLIALASAAAATTVAVSGDSVAIARTVTIMLGAVAFCAAMTGHAAGDDTHEVGTSTMMVHLLAVGVWAGGLAILQLLPASSRDDVRVVRGYSHLALICWIALAVSGVWALWVRMNDISEVLTSAYVQLGVAKAVLLLALAVLGAMQRREIAAGLASARGRGANSSAQVYRRLALLELALMGLAVALAAAMSSSPPPAEVSVPESSPAAVLSGYPLPSEPTLGSILTSWRPDPAGMAVACVLLLAWWRPNAPRRTAAASGRLIAAVVVLVLLTSGPLNVYSKVLVSAHVLQHLLLLIAVGGLVGTVGAVPRLVSTVCRRSWWVPVLVAVVPITAVIGTYASPYLIWEALDGHALHLALQALAIIAGTTAAWAIRSAPKPLLVAGAAIAVLAAAAIVLALTDTLVAASWFGSTGRTWWPDALADQQRGGIAALAVVAVTAVNQAVQLGRRTAHTSSDPREPAAPERD